MNMKDNYLEALFFLGTRMKEQELPEMPVVSLTIIRELLRQLESEKHILKEAKRGLNVRESSLNEVKEIYQFRRVLGRLVS